MISMIVEIHRDEIFMCDRWLPINDRLFQIITCIVENAFLSEASKCTVRIFAKGEVVLFMNETLITRNPFDNIIKTLHELFEELHFEDYEILDKRKGDDLIC